MRQTILSSLLAAAVFAAPILRPLPARAYDGPPSFADEAAHLLPGVVNVSTTETLKNPQGQPSPDAPGPQGTMPFEQFFHDFMQHEHPGMVPPDGGDPGEGVPGTRHLQSLGSGFVIDPAGYIVTNNHVIDGADKITVTFQDNTSVPATLVGHDDRTDLALLKITPPAGKTLTTVSWGNSDSARVGDWVIAIGDPFGLGGTVTAGIVSSLGRDINQGPYDDFIQTDAPINRGNSGGPLFNMQGQVIGINTAIYSPSGGSIGIGFSIPANLARVVVAELRQYGHVRRGWLGVRIQQVTPEIAESLGLPSASGAMVAGVNAGGPAEKAGLKPGDVILTFNDVTVKEMRNLPLIVAETPIGHDVPVQIWRNGKKTSLAVDVGEMPNDVQQASLQTDAPPPPPALKTTDLAGLGLGVAAIGPVARHQFQLPPDQKGVVITSVKTNSPASDRGLAPGNVIVEVQQTPVATIDEIKSYVARARAEHKKSILLLVQTQDGMRFVPLPTG